jgi:hypothetical protein
MGVQGTENQIISFEALLLHQRPIVDRGLCPLGVCQPSFLQDRREASKMLRTEIENRGKRAVHWQKAFSEFLTHKCPKSLVWPARSALPVALKSLKIEKRCVHIFFQKPSLWYQIFMPPVTFYSGSNDRPSS